AAAVGVGTGQQGVGAVEPPGVGQFGQREPQIWPLVGWWQRVAAERVDVCRRAETCPRLLRDVHGAPSPVGCPIPVAGGTRGAEPPEGQYADSLPSAVRAALRRPAALPRPR